MPQNARTAGQAAYEAHQQSANLTADWKRLSEIEVTAWESAAAAALAFGDAGPINATDPPPGGGHGKP